MDPKDLMRRAVNRARLSPDRTVRRAFQLARLLYRALGRWFPFLQLGWMSSLRRATWDGDDLVLGGWAFVRGVDFGASPEFRVWLRSRFSLVRIRAEVSRVKDDDVLGVVKNADLRYEQMAFEARFSGHQLAELRAGRTWQVRVGVKGEGRRTWGPLRRLYAFGSPAVMQLRPQGESRLVGPVFHERRGVLVVSRRPGHVVRDVSVSGREVTLRLDADASVTSGVLSGRGQKDVELTAEAGADGIRLTGVLPAGRMVVDKVTGDRHPPTWTAHAVTGRDRRSLTLLDDAQGHAPGPDSSLLVRGGSDRALQVVDVPHHVVVDDVERVDDGPGAKPYLRLSGTISGDPDAFSLVVSAPRLDVPVTIESVQDGRFTATIPLHVSVWDGPELPIPRGVYDLEGRVGDEAFSTFVSPSLGDRVPIVDSRADLRLRFELAERDEFRFRVTRPRLAPEYGSYNQNILFERYANGGLPALDAVMFESFFGRNSTCNPRAIDREIARRRPDLPRYWSVEDYSIEVPEGSVPLIIGSQEWWRVRESARWIVTNEWLKTQYVKRPFQTVLQTWHGSMYKQIGLDRSTKGGAHLDKARQERARWDLFISQNSDTTPIIARAYDFELDDIVECGYPRNDDLVNPDPARVEQVRKRLGIPEGTTVVMYAPTWREKNQQVELLNVLQLSDQLGPDFTFLQRGHVRTLDLSEVVSNDHVIDVSTYPQINDLYLAADLLITDYSSMMFDYSVTRRPMIFFTPDFDEYTDPKVRGVYFDLEEIAPGPVVRKPGQVIELLRSIESWTPTFDERYQAWTTRFNHADDGHAAERATDALFAFVPASREG